MVSVVRMEKKRHDFLKGVVMIDERLRNKYYSRVPEEVLRKFDRFQEMHPLKKLSVDGQSITYLLAGQGDHTILSFSGGHSTPESAYETVCAFENDYRFMIVDISPFDTAEKLNTGINRILQTEKIQRVILFGQSLAGIIAQIYFHENRKQVDALVLINTPVPKKEKNKKWALWMIHLMPFFILRGLFKMKLKKLADTDDSVPSEASGRIRFVTARMQDCLDHVFDKQVMMHIMHLCFEFNDLASGMDDLTDWTGRALIVTSEDDPYYADAQSMVTRYPNATLHAFPRGMGHMAPIVHRDAFLRVIKNFLKNR